MKAFGKTGSPIIFAVELVPAVSHIQSGSFVRDAVGTIEFDYAGQTDCNWDCQTQVEEDGKRVFEDEAGNRWTEDQLVLKD